MYTQRFGQASHGRRNRFNRRSNRKVSKGVNPSLFINKITSSVEENVYEPKFTFEDFNISPELKSNLKYKGFHKPMPIQDQAIPHLLQGKDLIGIANTGTGKTLAFLVPMLEKVMNLENEKVLIIAPTRELAVQIEEDLHALTYRIGVNKVVCIGGTSINQQIYKLRMNNQFVIGTPGRLLDLEKRRALNFNRFTNIVLDEVDRMFDMGFVDDIKFILSQLPESRQSLFFSATLDNKIEGLIRSHSKDPVMVSVKTRETADHVDQDVVKVAYGQNKMEVLHDMLIKEEFEKVLIFGRTKMGVHRLSEDLQRRGFKAESIHGDKTQYQRQRSLKNFKENRVNILVATDVAARGLDIPNVSHVINFEAPDNYTDYVHRIGRTGRGNKMGKALTFVQ
ncbi:MAG TPA: DEAD/DEAH box helicase [Candidatus Dojkabacteria bacterium]|nr:DEAD/DEAH box helicase [Candidatus Dojkabacteria bacterium]HRP36977.1 DEAD/DEAH box helicase [Candidatus Dojkabacteria bacterium]HRP50842.1 DEAD/DEAH box helicase [Candidatus Dojkabacteria bacterium]